MNVRTRWIAGLTAGLMLGVVSPACASASQPTAKLAPIVQPDNGSRLRLCLEGHTHVCMAALHPGLNSRIVLRRAANVSAQDIRAGYDQLRFGETNTCIGMNARTIRCGSTGTGWPELVTVNDAVKFYNAYLTVHDMGRAHWLTASGIDPGFRVIQSTDWRLSHKWVVECFHRTGTLGHRRCTAAHRPGLMAKRIGSHQLCLSAGRHLCAADSHPGVNSAMVLRVDADVYSQNIVYRNGRLYIKGYPGQCAGGDRFLVTVRSAHCRGGHGIRWVRYVVPGHGVEFANVAATNADPNQAPHFLGADFQQRGQKLVITKAPSSPHVWKVCTGGCTTS